MPKEINCPFRNEKCREDECSMWSSEENCLVAEALSEQSAINNKLNVIVHCLKEQRASRVTG